MKTDSLKCTIYYDTYCHLCNWFVRFLLHRDKQDVFRFRDNQVLLDQSEEIISTLDVEKAVVVEFDGRYLIASEAVIQVLALLPFPWHLLKLFRFIPKGIRDHLYFLISKNRTKWFRKLEQCPIIPEFYRHKFPD